MSDLISRQAALSTIDKNRQDLLSLGMDGAEHILVHYGRRVIEELPSAQPEIIRCKDCRWWDAKEDGYEGYCHAAKHGYYSRNWEIEIYRLYGPYFFCADGEVRGGEE